MQNRVKLEQNLIKNGYPAFRAKQIYQAIYKENKECFDSIITLPVKLREFLTNNEEINILSISPVFHAKSQDGTIKTLFQLQDGKKIEAVMMPFEDGRITVCVSSQVGCALRCKFCATGTLGFGRNLTAEEITDQVLYYNQILAKEGTRVSHVVYMGMGEPFLNFEEVKESLLWLNDPLAHGIAARNLTVSTSGIADQIMPFADIGIQANLAISLHAPDQETRQSFMPIAKKYQMEELIAEIQKYLKTTHRRVSYEYVMLRNVNDSTDQAHALGKLLKGQLCHVNLIQYNATDSKYQGTDIKQIRDFEKITQSYGVPTTLRISKGQDIDAACGQLALKN